MGRFIEMLIVYSLTVVYNPAISDTLWNCVPNSSISETTDRSDVTEKKIVNLRKLLQQLSGQRHADRVRVVRQFLSNQNVYEDGVTPSLIYESQSDGEFDEASNDIIGFAVFVDSPIPGSDGDKKLSVRYKNPKKTRLGSNTDGPDLRNEMTNYFENGTLFHDIHILVKHPSGVNDAGWFQYVMVNTSDSTRGGARSMANDVGKATNGSILLLQRNYTKMATEKSTKANNQTANFVDVETIEATHEPPGMKDDRPAEISTADGECSGHVVLKLPKASESQVSKCLLSCLVTSNSKMRGTKFEKTNLPYSSTIFNDENNISAANNRNVTLYGTYSETTVPNLSSVNIQKDGSGKINGEENSTMYGADSNFSMWRTKIENTTRPYQGWIYIDEDGGNKTNINENITMWAGTETNFTTLRTNVLNEADQNRSTNHNHKANINETSKEDGTDSSDSSEFSIDSVREKNLIENLGNSELHSLIDELCLTESCVVKAADILRRMNLSIDPCQDFYEFACGRFLNKGIPSDEGMWSVFKETTSDILFKMSSLLRKNKEIADDSYLSAMKDFYGKCMETTPTKMLIEILRELGGWPAPGDSKWDYSAVDWQDTAFNWTFGVFAEHNLLLLNISYDDATAKWILNVDFPVFIRLALQHNSFDLVMSAVERETISRAASLGVDEAKVRNSLDEIRVFMRVAVRYADMSKVNKIEGVYTLRDLRTRFPYLHLFKKLPSFLSTAVNIGDDDLIHVSNLIYLQRLNGLVRDTPVKTLVCFLVMTAIRSLFTLVEMAKDNTRGNYCVKIAWKLYPHFMGNVYASSFVDESTVRGALNTLSRIEVRIDKSLDENEWMDETKKRIARDKLRYLSHVIINYKTARKYLKDSFLTKTDSNSTFASLIKAGIWNFKKNAYTLVGQSYHDTIIDLVERYTDNGYEINSHYYADRIFIPLSLMHENIYNTALPSYVNFGGFGVAVGHEIVHGVLEGDYLNDTKEYLDEEQCLIDQFNSFTEKHVQVAINGKLTKNENIADLGGFREAYRAYVEWASIRSEEKRLPGLQKFSAKQMFWLTAASSWCQIAVPKTVIVALFQDNHAPAANRINGQFSNFPEFSRDFHCPLNSPMNPKEKCSLW